MDRLLCCSLLLLSGLLYEASAGSVPTTAFHHSTSSTKDIRSTATTPGNIRDTKPTSRWTISTSSRSSHQATTSTSKATTSRPVLTAVTAKSTASVTSRGTTSGTEGAATTSPAPGKSLVMLAFGVMSFILILIVVMVVLVTAVNLRGRCSSAKEDGKKSCDSIVLESNVTSGEKESITLVSMKTINTDTDTDSPQISSIHSTTLDNEDQELGKELLNVKMV
ncbi:endothelial cell-specific chemotaxis regulator isoform X2 [Scleropages formosus]|uniref:endothelial cell-specific chemotaxis regulator isoform X2 n=1 Tax=Scleropages formosus TaxID=113540 RepID=UPI000877EBE6|nr:endothelial cell-specific chemotaxis regulator isoform X2 [Scleropages formosus]